MTEKGRIDLPMEIPLKVSETYYDMQGVEVACVCDKNGIWVFDCFKVNVDDAISRINTHGKIEDALMRCAKTLREYSPDDAKPFFDILNGIAK